MATRKSEILKQIVTAEKEAHKAVQAATVDAEKIVQAARKQALEIIASSETVPQWDENTGTLASAEAIRTEGKSAAQKLSPEARAHFDQAADEAVSLVMPR
jgi:vacuolar-type H+-ATPase subunit H